LLLNAGGNKDVRPVRVIKLKTNKLKTDERNALECRSRRDGQGLIAPALRQRYAPAEPS
jgi:hypothetical protein